MLQVLAYNRSIDPFVMTPSHDLDQCTRTVAVTPAWSESHKGGNAWNGVSPKRLALCVREAACVRTRSIRELSSEVGFINVEF